MNIFVLLKISTKILKFILFYGMDILKKLVEDGLTIPQISREMEISESSVCRLLKKFSLKTKRHIDHQPDAITKKCRYCFQEKPIDEFHFSGVAGDVKYRRHKCKDCYFLMKCDRRLKIRKWFVDYKKALKCDSCGNCDFRVLDFHHKDDNKEADISEVVSSSRWGKKRIMKEIEKCVVLCANCHRILHYEQKHQGVG